MEACRTAFQRVAGSALGPYQTAVVRIGFSFTWLFFLLREWPHRHELYGPDSPWSWELGRGLVDGNGAFTVLLWSDGRLWFELVYLFALAASAMLLLGWRTRTASALFMVGVLSLQNRSIVMGDGGDNVIHLVATYLVLTRCGLVWSLDARNRRRRGLRDRTGEGGEAPEPGVGPLRSGGEPRRDAAGVALWAVFGGVLLVATVLGRLSWGWSLVFWGLWTAQALWWAVDRQARGSEARAVLDAFANLAHNGALLVISAEVCLIYAAAGWYKIQGSRWQDGTAVYYPLHLDYFSPWPFLADLLVASGLVVMLITYATVVVQVAFPFTLLNRRVKNLLLPLMMLEHAGMAVTLGLPFFSLAMIAADAVFLPTAFLLWVDRGAVRLGGRLRPAGREGPEAEDGDGGAGAGPVGGTGGGLTAGAEGLPRQTPPARRAP
nr:HTTM domain-containing protein [Streptomyces sp. TP-A0874]